MEEGFEVIGVSSVHGRSKQQIGRPLNNDTLYWDKTKGSQLVNALGLQLPSQLRSDANLSRNNIKTNEDLGQADGVKFSRTPLDKVARGGSGHGYLNMGRTPEVLELLGLPKTKVSMMFETVHKAMKGKHAISAEAMKQLPAQLNDPVAVMESAPGATADGYVVLTELTEKDAQTGRAKPVIAALHIKRTANGFEVVNIASVYGRSKSQIQASLNDVVYWHKTKGPQLVNAFGLQLPSVMRSAASLSKNNIKTNEDLGQADKVKFSRTEDNGLARVPLDKAGSKRRSWLFPKEWTNERGELLAGARAYEKLGSLLQPALAKARMVNTHPESFTQYMRDFRAQKNTAGKNMRRHTAATDTDSLLRNLLSNAQSDGGHAKISIVGKPAPRKFAAEQGKPVRGGRCGRSKFCIRPNAPV